MKPIHLLLIAILALLWWCWIVVPFATDAARGRAPQGEYR